MITFREGQWRLENPDRTNESHMGTNLGVAAGRFGPRRRPVVGSRRSIMRR